MKVAEMVARSFVDAGVSRVFSLLGDVNMAVVAQMASLGIPIYEARHEAVAMAMADGYSRATGEVALCAVTAGPAFAHALVPLASAVRSRSSVVVMTGPRSRDDLADRQRLDLEGIARVGGAIYIPIASPKLVAERARSAVDQARSLHTPVVVDLPADIQEMETSSSFVERDRPKWLEPQRLHPDRAVIEAAAGIMQSATKPVVLAGAGAAASGARDALGDLARQWGALTAAALNARGFFDGDPFDAGVAGQFSSVAAARLFADADCVLSVGASLNRFTTQGGALFPAARFIQIDNKPPGPMESGDAADCYIQADALIAVTELHSALSAGPSKVGFRTDEVKAQLSEDMDPKVFEIDSSEVDPRILCSELDRLLPAECGWVSGNSGHFWAFPVMHMTRWRQPMLFGTYVGAIGYGIPVALGASLSDLNRPIVVFEGDASLMLNVHVLETMARYRAKLLVVVMNDRALGAEYHKLRSKDLDEKLSIGPDTSLAALAAVMGCRSATLTHIDDLAPIVNIFLEGPGPLLLDVRTSRNVVSRLFRRDHFGLD